MIPLLLTPRVSIKSATLRNSECLSKDGQQNITQKDGTSRPKLSSGQLEKLFSKIDLSGIQEWTEQEQK